MAEEVAYTLCELLQGTFDSTEVEDVIRKHYPGASRDSITAAADAITELHCSGMGYDLEDIEAILATIVVLPLTRGGVTIGQ
jgi:hypothetical protein